MSEDARMGRLLDAIEIASTPSELELAKSKLETYKATLES